MRSTLQHEPNADPDPDLATDERAQIDLTGAFKVAGVMIGVVVVSAIVAAVLGDVFSNVADVNAVFNDANTSLNDTTSDNLLPIFPILLGLTLLFGVVSLIIASFRFKSD